MAVRQCLICGFQLQLGVSSQLAPFLFRAPSLSFICSIHFDDQCLTSVNRVWYLKKDSIPTLYLGSNFDLKKYSNDKSEDVLSDVESQLKQSENAVTEFLTTKSSLSVGEIDTTKIVLTSEECGDPQNLTSRLRVLKFNYNTQTWSYECDRFSEIESWDSSPSPLIPFIASDKEVSFPCMSLECASVSSLDTIVAPMVPRCSSMVEIPLRKSIRQKFRPQRYQGNEIVSNLRHEGIKRAGYRLIKLKKSLINGEAVGVEPIVECQNVESYQVDDIDGFLIFSFTNSQDLVKFCADQ